MSKKIYTISTALSAEELLNGLENKCLSRWQIFPMDPFGESGRIYFRRVAENDRIILIPVTGVRNSARRNHHLKLVENENGTLIEVSSEFDPMVIFIFLVWWVILIFIAVSVLINRNYFLLPGIGAMAVFALLVTWLCCKKAEDELPATKQALREIIAEIEVDCGK